MYAKRLPLIQVSLEMFAVFLLTENHITWLVIYPVRKPVLMMQTAFSIATFFSSQETHRKFTETLNQVRSPS